LGSLIVANSIPPEGFNQTESSNQTIEAEAASGAGSWLEELFLAVAGG